MTSPANHFSVLLDESIQGLAINPDGFYIDGTFGRGGHSQEVLKRLSDKGRLMVFDKDQQAKEYFEQHFAKDARVTFQQTSFANMLEVLKQQGLAEKVDGVLLDLGVSSPQLDQAERGFSFLRDGPLDMRMGQLQTQTAATWLAEAKQHEIKNVLRIFGEERFAPLIATKIVERRDKKPFTHTLDLAEFIRAVIPSSQHGNKHPATRSFQAIRIHINQELDDLKRLLDDAMEILAPKGRLVVISFHSLEDRLVKQFFRKQDKGPVIPRNIPITEFDREPHLKIVGKAIKADASELEQNVRSRSAVMRIAEKVVA